MIARKLAFPATAEKAVAFGAFHVRLSSLFAAGRSSSIDSDARRYCQLAGVTTALARRQISDFVTGAKRLDLYRSLMCFPLRLPHNNPGAGTTLRSLGGLGSYTATMVNSPAIGESGITFTPASVHHLISTWFYQTGNFWSGVDVRMASTASNMAIFAQDDPAADRDFSVELGVGLPPAVRFLANLGSGISQRINLTSASSTARQFLQFSYDGATFTGKRNTTAQTTASVAGTMTSSIGFRIGAKGNDTLPFNGIIGFFFFINQATTDSLQNNFFALYKSTLGQGLGLP